MLAELGVSLYATDEKPANEFSDAIAAAESFGARFVEAAAVEALLPSIDSAVLSPGVPLHLAGRALDPCSQRAGPRRDRTGLPPLQGADRRRHGDEGKVHHDRADRASAARLRPERARGRQHRQSADSRSSRRRTGRLGRRRGFVVSARNDSVVSPAGSAPAQHRAGPPRPLPFDGRVRRSEVPYLRQSVHVRLVRRKPGRRAHRGARLAPRGGARTGPPTVVFAGTQRRDSCTCAKAC